MWHVTCDRLSTGSSTLRVNTELKASKDKGRLEAFTKWNVNFDFFLIISQRIIFPGPLKVILRLESFDGAPSLWSYCGCAVLRLAAITDPFAENSERPRKYRGSFKLILKTKIHWNKRSYECQVYSYTIRLPTVYRTSEKGIYQWILNLRWALNRVYSPRR